MKQEYVQPSVAMLRFSVCDVMAASGNGGGNGGGNYRPRNTGNAGAGNRTNQGAKPQIDIAGYRK